MKPKLNPPPSINPETMKALLAAAMDFGAAKPWEVACDSDVVGLSDPLTHEIRLASIMGQAKEVFGVAIYRRVAGINWILTALDSPDDIMDLDLFAEMDAIKLDFVPRSELHKEDKAMLKALDFKPPGKGAAWPQFQSSKPGWLPWFIDQEEAEQLTGDLKKLTRFIALFRQHPEIFENRPVAEFPFLPATLPNRPLELEDLDWRPIIPPVNAPVPFEPTAEQLSQIKSLARNPESQYQYGCWVMQGCNLVEQGQPSYTRCGLLVDSVHGLVLGFDITLASLAYHQCVGQSLVKTLVKSGHIPGFIFCNDERVESILNDFCSQLGIEVIYRDDLVELAEARESLNGYMGRGRV